MTRRKDIGPSDNGGEFAEQRRAKPSSGLSARDVLEAQYGDATVETLDDMILFAEQAERLVAQGREAYDSNEFLRLASEAVIHRMGEAVSRLPDEFTKNHPGVSWRQMRGTRNIVSHNYNAINHNTIWNALSEHLPSDAARIRTILEGSA